AREVDPVGAAALALEERRTGVVGRCRVDAWTKIDRRLPCEIVVRVLTVRGPDVEGAEPAAAVAREQQPVSVAGEGRGADGARGIDGTSEIDRQPERIVVRVALRHPQVLA